MSDPKTILVIGTYDTKDPEMRYLEECARKTEKIERYIRIE